MSTICKFLSCRLLWWCVPEEALPGTLGGLQSPGETGPERLSSSHRGTWLHIVTNHRCGEFQR